MKAPQPHRVYKINNKLYSLLQNLEPCGVCEHLIWLFLFWWARHSICMLMIKSTAGVRCADLTIDHPLFGLHIGGRGFA